MKTIYSKSIKEDNLSQQRKMTFHKKDRSIFFKSKGRVFFWKNSQKGGEGQDKFKLFLRKFLTGRGGKDKT